MDDTRLKQIQALIDDARELVVEVVDSRPVDATVKDFNWLDASRQFLNSALVYVQKADDTIIPDYPPEIA